MDSYSSSHVDFLAYWIVNNMRFLVDDDIVVVAAENDAAVCMVQ